ncbi:DUF1244 domain-containing protein [Oceanicoccus sp. KOV_DT_Chl]|uniref:DUF1244 domain-containing protein n=1 Tax=Oceanicoccus sp. KOV_DT_Chl TaxID=1904639 RepID=UPI000C79CC2D|nr:DUF1244 domain-containing protein [Oceanicoccus sp. KOV_DT_Chl]
MKDATADLTHQQRTEIEAAVFRRLIQHLDENKQVQNIELMILANFCRNCLSKWYMAAAEEQGTVVDYDQAREVIYGMPYTQWKDKHQLEATPEQLEQFNNRGK